MHPIQRGPNLIIVFVRPASRGHYTQIRIAGGSLLLPSLSFCFGGDGIRIGGIAGIYFVPDGCFVVGYSLAVDEDAHVGDAVVDIVGFKVGKVQTAAFVAWVPGEVYKFGEGASDLYPIGQPLILLSWIYRREQTSTAMCETSALWWGNLMSLVPDCLTAFGGEPASSSTIKAPWTFILIVPATLSAN